VGEFKDEPVIGALSISAMLVTTLIGAIAMPTILLVKASIEDVIAPTPLSIVDTIPSVKALVNPVKGAVSHEAIPPSSEVLGAVLGLSAIYHNISKYAVPVK
jgi:hypothetical protein